MNGTELLCETLLLNGIDTCFATSGTSEMHFVAALDRQPQIRCVLALFEGVVTDAADGYARMADKPADTLLHLGPGLANLHNACRARTPVVNIVGEHATYRLYHDAPLTTDIDSLAVPMSHWMQRVKGAVEVGLVAGDAITAVGAGTDRVSPLILHADVTWSKITVAVPPVLPLPALAARYMERIVLNTDKLVRLNYADRLPHPAWIEQVEWLGKGAEDELHLIFHQTSGRLKSQLGIAPASRANYRDGREQVQKPPKAAERRGIRNGKTVRLWNSRVARLAAAGLNYQAFPTCWHWISPHRPLVRAVPPMPTLSRSSRMTARPRPCCNLSIQPETSRCGHDPSSSKGRLHLASGEALSVCAALRARNLTPTEREAESV